MSILITGARGNIGSRLVKTLTTAGHDVWASARDTTSLRLPPGATPLELDIADADSPGELPADVETVFLYPTLNGAAGFLRAARRSSVRYVLLLSSPASFEAGEHEGPIGQIHQTMEREIEESGLKHTFLYPSWLSSNAQRDWGDAIRTEGIVGLTPPDAQITPIHLNDVADVAAALLTSESHRARFQILTGPRSMTQEEAVGVIAKETGRELGVERVSKAVALARRPAAMPEALLPASSTPPPRQSACRRPSTTMSNGSPAAPHVRSRTGRRPIEGTSWLGSGASHVIWPGRGHPRGRARSAEEEPDGTRRSRTPLRGPGQLDGKPGRGHHGLPELRPEPRDAGGRQTHPHWIGRPRVPR